MTLIIIKKVEKKLNLTNNNGDKSNSKLCKMILHGK